MSKSNNESFFKRYVLEIAAIVVTLATIASLLVSCESKTRTLPILGERSAFQKKINGKTVTDTLYQTIPDFRLLNQDSTFVTNEFFDGKVYIADFFFTSCPTICPVMHRNLFKAYKRFKNEKDVLFLSHSVDFRHDTPSVLKSYSRGLGIVDRRWQLLTGPKEEIYPLAEKSYVSAAQDMPSAPGGYAHSGYLILVDRHRRLRGAYDGTDKKAVKQLIEDTQVLLAEK